MQKYPDISNQKSNVKDKVVHIYCVKHTHKISEEVFLKLRNRLPARMQEEIAAYKHRESAEASLLGKTVLQYGFDHLALGVKPEEIKVTPKDRPFLDGPIDFNISHSGHYVIAAIVKNARVGIDIEQHRELDVTLFRRYFDDAEWRIIQSSPDAMQTFFDYWAVKESAIKCDGRGVEVLSDTHLLMNNREELLTGNGQVTCAGRLFFYEKIRRDEKYSCSICCDYPFTFRYSAVTVAELVS